jgi:hypothetical protein
MGKEAVNPFIKAHTRATPKALHQKTMKLGVCEYSDVEAVLKLALIKTLTMPLAPLQAPTCLPQ